MPDQNPPFRLSGPARRVLLVLLSGAGNLSGYVITQAAHVGSGSAHPLLATLEREGWAHSAWGPGEPGKRRRFYALTAEGRARVMGLLGLEEPS